MYAVVGCRECRALWLVEGRPDTTRCPRCGTRRKFDRLRKLAETDDQVEARRARSALLSARQDDDASSTTNQSDQTTGNRQNQGRGPCQPPVEGTAGSPRVGGTETTAHPPSGSSRVDVIRTALRVLESPDEAAVVSYATDRGIDPDAAADVLRQLVRSGEVTRQENCYRLV